MTTAPIEVHRTVVRAMLAAGAQLVEVLPAPEYTAGHLPGAIHIPLRHVDRATTGGLAADQPVIVYCWDYQ